CNLQIDSSRLQRGTRPLSATPSSMSTNVLLTTVVPALGAVVSLLMYASPVMAVMAASKTKNMGDLNPVPFAITVANTIVWGTYALAVHLATSAGLIKQDVFVTTPNVLGVVVAMYCALSCYGLAHEETRDRMRLILCGESAILAALGVATSFGASTLQEQLNIWGIAGNCISLVYYAAPLSSMAEVLKTRNSASILLPLTVMNLANAALWTTYGMALQDVFIYAPNGIGLVLSLAQLGLACIYPSKPRLVPGASQLHDAQYAKVSTTGDVLPVSHK
ncbi:hypothetical protein QJQ45_017029, partial [Haematococcus lacustris]